MRSPNCGLSSSVNAKALCSVQKKSSSDMSPMGIACTSSLGDAAVGVVDAAFVLCIRSRLSCWQTTVKMRPRQLQVRLVGAAAVAEVVGEPCKEVHRAAVQRRGHLLDGGAKLLRELRVRSAVARSLP